MSTQGKNINKSITKLVPLEEPNIKISTNKLGHLRNCQTRQTLYIHAEGIMVTHYPRLTGEELFLYTKNPRHLMSINLISINPLIMSITGLSYNNINNDKNNPIKMSLNNSSHNNNSIYPMKCSFLAHPSKIIIFIP